MPARSLLLVTLALLASACATSLEQGLSADLAEQEQRLAAPRAAAGQRAEAGPAARFDGSVEGYVAYALEHSPGLRARFERWQASTHRIAQQRRLPEPTLTYGLYLSRVETRVGPQRHRLSLSQALPWPTKLSDGAEAAALEAQSAQRRFDAKALGIARRVREAYWRLWLVERAREVERDQLEVLDYLFESSRTRLEIGRAGLADVGQIQLSVSRLTDTLSGLDERRRTARAELLAAMGAPASTRVTVRKDPPPILLLTESPSSLREALAAHPEVESLGLLARSRRESASSAEAEGYPSFLIGVDYIETGAAPGSGVADSGKDAVILNMGVRIPLWWHVYGAKRDQALAEGAAFRSDQAALLDEAGAELEKALSAVRDTARRAKLYRGTLVPQAETVYGSLLGSYQTGEAPLAQLLLAQRDLLELQLGVFRAHAEHAAAWARLEAIAGREVRAKEAG